MDRRIKAVKKDEQGNIVALCNPGKSWSPRSVGDVVKDIRGNKRSYYVQESENRTYVRLLAGNELQTTADAASANGLDNLPSV